MGEAKRRETTTQKFISNHPFCALCGGVASATTRDHIPNIGLFKRRHRPEGLETPACHACNQNTKYAEQVAALMAGIYPDPGPEFTEEILARFRKVHKHDPKLFAELKDVSPKSMEKFKRSELTLPPNVSPLNANGPILNGHMNIFTVKCSIALHFHLTRNIVPATGAVLVRWFSNHEAAIGKFPAHLLSYFDGGKTLEQGKFNVGDQFEYSSKATKDEMASLHFCAFGRSFSFFGFVYVDDAMVPRDAPGQKFAPGFWNDH